MHSFARPMNANTNCLLFQQFFPFPNWDLLNFNLQNCGVFLNNFYFLIWLPNEISLISVISGNFILVSIFALPWRKKRIYMHWTIIRSAACSRCYLYTVLQSIWKQNDGFQQTFYLSDISINCKCVVRKYSSGLIYHQDRQCLHVHVNLHF